MIKKGRPTNRRRPAFGARLVAIRLEQGITQQTLAGKLNVNRSLVRYYERDTEDPKLSVVVRCAKALRVPIGALMSRRPEDHGFDRVVAHFGRRLMALAPKERHFVLRLFGSQLSEIRRRRRPT